MSGDDNNGGLKKGFEKDIFDDFRKIENFKCMIDPFYFIENYMIINEPSSGDVKFILYPYQKKIIEGFYNYRDVILLCGRQQGKTTCAAAYILWKVVTALKEKKETILVTANKLSQAQEILERIKYSYGLLPKWLVPGVIKNNERSMVFDNGSKILCRATTPDAGRGLSPTLVYIDEMAFIKKSIAAAFMTAIKPTLATGGKMFITSTPMNDEDEFAKIWNGATDKFDSNGNEIKNGIGSNGFYPLKFTFKDHPDRDPDTNPKWEMSWRASLGDARFRQEFLCVTGETKINILHNKNSQDVTIGELFNLLKENQ